MISVIGTCTNTHELYVYMLLLHCVIVLLEGPDAVLIERYSGKRVDSVTGGNYILPVYNTCTYLYILY